MTTSSSSSSRTGSCETRRSTCRTRTRSAARRAATGWCPRTRPRRSTSGSRPVVVRRPARTVRRMADRRLRLVLALSLAAFAVVVLRAAQIQVVDAAALSRKAVSQQRARPDAAGPARGDPERRRPAPGPGAVVEDDRGRQGSAAAPAPRRGGHRPRSRLPPAQEAPPPQAPQEAEVPAEPRVAGPRAGDRGSAAAAAAAGSCASSSPRSPPGSWPSTCPGISTVTELTRWYPFHGLAPQVIGYTQVPGPGRPEGAGLAGIEQQYNKVLDRERPAGRWSCTTRSARRSRPCSSSVPSPVATSR